MTDALVVRLATDDDVDRVGQLWGAMYEHQRASGMVLPLRPDAVELWTRGLRGRASTPTSAVFVAAGEAGIIGFLAAQIKRLPPYLAAASAKVGFISEVYVQPESRRTRAGRRLVDAAFAWFDAAGVGSVELHVLIDNAEGRGFWRSLGFADELVQMRAMRS